MSFSSLADSGGPMTRKQPIQSKPTLETSAGEIPTKTPEFYSVCLQTLPVPAMVIDSDYTITFINKAGADLVGTASDTCIGKKCYEILGTDRCGNDGCCVAQVLSTGAVATGDAMASLQTGTIPITFTASPIRSESGEIDGIIEYFTDASRAVAQKADTRDQNELLNLLPAPVMAVDRDYTITYINKAGADAVGLPPEKCIGQKCHSLFGTDHCNTKNCCIRRAMEEDAACTDDTIAHLPAGDMPIRYTGIPLKDASGAIIGGLEYITDISEEDKTVADIRDLVAATVAGKLDTRGNQYPIYN